MKIAFLRAINVGGRNVKMERLRAIFRAGGFDDVATFIASGNVIFRDGGSEVPATERQIESMLERELGYPVATFVRGVDEVAAIARSAPFESDRVAAAQAFNVGLLHQALGPSQLSMLDRLRSEIDDFVAIDREVYWLCSKKQSESRFSNARFERALGVQSTFRSIRTMRRLAERVAVD